MISSSHPAPPTLCQPHFPTHAPTRPLIPQRLSHAPTPLSRLLTPISALTSHALSATLPAVDLCFFSPSHLMLSPPHPSHLTISPIYPTTYSPPALCKPHVPISRTLHHLVSSTATLVSPSPRIRGAFDALSTDLTKS